jgi:hypothetical protein
MQLRVSIVRGKRAGQRLGGKDTCADDRVARKWFLAVRIDRSAGQGWCGVGREERVGKRRFLKGGRQ